MSTKQFMLSTLTDLANTAVQPSIAMSGSKVVAIYRDGSSTGTALYYQAGTIDGSEALDLGAKTGVPQKGNSGNTDSGETPTIAINNQGVVIEIHESDGPSSELWTHVGQLNGLKITWGDSQDAGHSGNTPSVALAYISSTHLAVAVYESSGNIYTLIGTVSSSSKTVSWSKLSGNFSGYNPRVAINNNNDVVVVFDNGGSNVYSLVGQINSSLDNISWASSAYKFDNHAVGYAAVGLSDDGFVVTAYQGAIADKNDENSVSYVIRTQAGALDSDTQSIAWVAGFTAGMGKKPSITTNGSQVVLLQESPDTKTSPGGTGASTTSNLTEVNYATSNVGNIHLGRALWMGKYQNKTLSQLCIPAAHDAGMSTVGYCTNLIGKNVANAVTQTQSKDFKAMLDCGIRYFDVRPVWFKQLDGTVISYTGHFTSAQGGIGCLGLTMHDVFKGVRDFLQEGYNTEVIILKFSHYFEQIENNNGIDTTIVDDGTHDDIFNPLKQDLIESLVEYFDLPHGNSWLYLKPNTETRRLVDIPLSQITGGQAKIIAVFDDVDIEGLFSTAGITDQKTINLYNYAKELTYSYKDYATSPPPTVSDYDFVVFDQYSNTDDLSVMTSANTPADANHPGQVYLYLQSGNHDADLYLLSWTLTQQLDDQLAGDPSIQTLAGWADGCLGQYLQTLMQRGHITGSFYPNLLYVDFCDTFVTDAAVYVNNYLYGE